MTTEIFKIVATGTLVTSMVGYLIFGLEEQGLFFKPVWVILLVISLFGIWK